MQAKKPQLLEKKPGPSTWLDCQRQQESKETTTMIDGGGAPICQFQSSLLVRLNIAGIEVY
jgi:hypothetical protein